MLSSLGELRCLSKAKVVFEEAVSDERGLPAAADLSFIMQHDLCMYVKPVFERISESTPGRGKDHFIVIVNMPKGLAECSASTPASWFSWIASIFLLMFSTIDRFPYNKNHRNEFVICLCLGAV